MTDPKAVASGKPPKVTSISERWARDAKVSVRITVAVCQMRPIQEHPATQPGATKSAPATMKKIAEEPKASSTAAITGPVKSVAPVKKSFAADAPSAATNGKGGAPETQRRASNDSSLPKAGVKMPPSVEKNKTDAVATPVKVTRDGCSLRKQVFL